MLKLASPGRYAMFLRKSREDIEAEREGEFETLAKHEAALTRLAEDRGLAVVHVYRELVSGDSLQCREDAMQMLEDVKSGAYDGVLAYDLQRITRGDMVDQGTIVRVFALTGTAIITPTKDYDLSDELDETFAELEMIYGRRELNRISRRLIGGKEEATRQGQYLGSIPPFGWRKVQRGRKKTLEPSEDHELLVRMYEDIASWSRTPDKIADDLNLIGFPTPRGKHWDGGTVSYIVRNPVNKGYVRWNQRRTVKVLDEGMNTRKKRRDTDDLILVEGLHRGTGAISDELWESANRQLDRHASSKEYSYRPLQNPLATLLVCAKCGRVMTRTLTTQRFGKEPRYTHPKSNRYECNAVSSTEEAVVGMVIESLAEAAEDIELTLQLDDGSRLKSCAARMEALAKAAEKERAGIGNLLRLAEKGLVTDEEFAGRRKAIEERVAGIEAERAAVGREMESLGGARERLVKVRQAIDGLRDYEGRAGEVNDALKSVVRRIEYAKDPQTKELHLRVFLH